MGGGGKLLNIKELYGIGATSRIVLCVGNVCRRKNQGQLIKAFDLLKKEIAMNTYVLFLGGNIEPGYTIEALSKDSKYASHFISCGVVDKEQVHFYYEQGDAVALMSLSEGFGLSLIEGMHFGLPCISFTDVDAFDDIYSPEVMVGVEGHSDLYVAQGMEKLLGDGWNKDQIINYSKKFESQQMAVNYVKVYQRTV